MPPSTERELDEEVRRVMEGIGRCLVIYQRIELCLKYLLPQVVGPDGKSPDTLSQWRSLLDSKTTLGPLVERLRESVRSNDPKNFNHYVGELVEQRNELIHHFSRLPFARLSSFEECDTALADLRRRIDFALPLYEALDGMLRQFHDALREAKHQV